MSLTSIIGADIYQQMLDLQEKLKESEAKRAKLEKMFSVLIKTYKKEEEMRLHNLESRYHSFLEDCARRTNRNENILRSLEKVESGANVLYAKTERLKLLRSHYEAYLERIIPTWKTVVPRYGPFQLLPGRYGEWARPNKKFQEEILPPHGLNYRSISRCGNFRGPNTEIYFSTSPETHQLNKMQLSNRENCNSSFWTQGTRETELTDRIVEGRGKERVSEEDLDFRTSGAKSSSILNQRKYTSGYFDEDDNEVPAPFRFEWAAEKKGSRGDEWNSMNNILSPKGSLNEVSDSHVTAERPGRRLTELSSMSRAPNLNAPFYSSGEWRKADNFLPENLTNPCMFGEEYVCQEPMMTREPVEIKKPEYIAGKLHSKDTSYFKVLNKEKVQEQHIPTKAEFETTFGDLKSVSEQLKIQDTDSHPDSLVRWNLLKHKINIDKLKEALAYDDNEKFLNEFLKETIKSAEKVAATSTNKALLPGSAKEDNMLETCISQSLSSSEEKQILSTNEIVDDINSRYKEVDTKSKKEADTEVQPDKDYPKESMQDTDFGGFEDNEETYPESYYEQPPQSQYSRNIVSNVILEEDETEVNINAGDLEKANVDSSAFQETIENYDAQESTQFETVYEEADTVNNINLNGGNENQLQGPESSDINAGYNDENEYYSSQNYQNDPTGIYDSQNMITYEQQHNVMTMEQGDGYDHPYAGSEEPQEVTTYDHAQEQSFDYQGENLALGEYNERTYEQQYQGEQNFADGYYDQQDVFYQGQMSQKDDFVKPEGNSDAPEIQEFDNRESELPLYTNERNNLPLRQSNLAHLLESDSESFQIEHGSGIGNDDSDFDFSLSQQQ